MPTPADRERERKAEDLGVPSGRAAPSDEHSTVAAREAWAIIGDDPANLHIVDAAQPHMRVCFLTSDGPTERRARLIAAAPDLLSALQSIASCTSPGNRTLDELLRCQMLACDIARAAIAKAEGR